MMEKIKSNLTYVICAILGLFNFIFLAFPYLTVYSKSNLGYGNYSDGMSGYKILKIWGKEEYYLDDAKFGGVMSSLVQLFILLLGIALLAWGVMGLLKAFGIFGQFPDKLGKLESRKLGEFGLFGLAGLNVLLLVFLIIFTATNTEKINEYGYTIEGGYKLSAGIFIALILTAGAVVALKLLEKKLPAGGSTESVSYVCAKCGKKAKAADKFCSACGGEIEKKVAVKEEYACVKCGKKAKASDKFCNACGGEIEKRSAVKEEFACVKCGKSASGKEKFCSECGGEIKVKDAAAPVEEAAAIAEDAVPEG